MGIEAITQGAVAGNAAVVGPQLPRQEEYPAGRGTAALPAYVVAVSPEGRALSAQSPGDGAVSAQGVSHNKGATGTKECQTCKNRRYVDRSNDSSVSFQSPTRVSPGAAEGAVRAHEQEHVSHEQARAAESGQRVVFQSVSIQYAICPECGRSYVAGGTTTTVTKAELQPGAAQQAPTGSANAGARVDLTV